MPLRTDTRRPRGERDPADSHAILARWIRAHAAVHDSIGRLASAAPGLERDRRELVANIDEVEEERLRQLDICELEDAILVQGDDDFLDLARQVRRVQRQPREQRDQLTRAFVERQLGVEVSQVGVDVTHLLDER
eukprot:scaffold4882_cov70-Phaeocystis_antarctica.AAC.5